MRRAGSGLGQAGGRARSSTNQLTDRGCQPSRAEGACMRMLLERTRLTLQGIGPPSTHPIGPQASLASRTRRSSTKRCLPLAQRSSNVSGSEAIFGSSTKTPKRSSSVATPDDPRAPFPVPVTPILATVGNHLTPDEQAPVFQKTFDRPRFRHRFHRTRRCTSRDVLFRRRCLSKIEPHRRWTRLRGCRPVRRRLPLLGRNPRRGPGCSGHPAAPIGTLALPNWPRPE